MTSETSFHDHSPKIGGIIEVIDPTIRLFSVASLTVLLFCTKCGHQTDIPGGRLISMAGACRYLAATLQKFKCEHCTCSDGLVANIEHLTNRSGSGYSLPFGDRLTPTPVFYSLFAEPTLEQLMTRAREQAERGHFAKAESEYSTILSNWPATPSEEHNDQQRSTLLLESGEVAILMGKYPKAERLLREVAVSHGITESPEFTLTLSCLALLYGRYDEAALSIESAYEKLTKARALSSDDSDAIFCRMVRGQIFLAKGDYENAEFEFWAISCRVESLSYRSEIAGLDQLANLQQVLLRLKRPSAIPPPKEKFGRIPTRDRPPDFTGAEEIFREALFEQRSNSYPWVDKNLYEWTLWRLAWIIAQQGRLDEAEKLFRTIWKNQRRPHILGEKHPFVAYTAFWIAKTFDYRGQTLIADNWLRGVEQILTNALHEKHVWIREFRTHMSLRAGPLPLALDPTY